MTDNQAPSRNQESCSSPQEECLFAIKKWNAVALWSWDVTCDTCAICKLQLVGRFTNVDEFMFRKLLVILHLYLARLDQSSVLVLQCTILLSQQNYRFYVVSFRFILLFIQCIHIICNCNCLVLIINI